MILRPTVSSRSDSLFPYPTLFLSLGALEEQVLDEVRDARLRLGLVARAGADPEAQRHRSGRGNALGDDPLAGIQLRKNVFLHGPIVLAAAYRSEEHTSELQSLMRISYAVFCLKKKQHNTNT